MAVKQWAEGSSGCITHQLMIGVFTGTTLMLPGFSASSSRVVCLFVIFGNTTLFMVRQSTKLAIVLLWRTTVTSRGWLEEQEPVSSVLGGAVFYCSRIENCA